MEELIKKIQKGDEVAFKQLTQSMEKDLYVIAKLRLKNDDDIKDAIQNTMISVYKNAKKMRNIKYFKTWMFRILINECNKIYNSNNRKNNILDKLKVNSTYNNYENSIQLIDDKLNFESIINQLNYDEKIIITLYYHSQFSCAEISKLLKININTVKSRLKRAKDKLKKQYGEVEIYEKK